MPQANLKGFIPDLPPEGRLIRQRVLADGDPGTSRFTVVRLGSRPDRRDFEPSRCLAKRKGRGDQCGRFPASGRVVCIVHGAGSARRQQEGNALPPEVSGAIGSAIRDVRRGRRQLDDLAAFFPDLQERLEAYRKEPERLELRQDAAHLTALRDLLLSGKMPFDLLFVLTQVPRLAVAKAKVLSSREAIERRHAVSIEHHHKVTEQLVELLRRYVPPELHVDVARDLRLLGAQTAV